MTGLIIFGIVAIIAIAYMIYRSNTKTTIDEPEIPIPVDINNTPDFNLNEFIGEANPSQANMEAACNVIPTRLYYVNSHDGFTKISKGDILYNKYPDEVTDGGRKWIGLENLATGEINIVRVGISGTILEVDFCN